MCKELKENILKEWKEYMVLNIEQIGNSTDRWRLEKGAKWRFYDWKVTEMKKSLNRFDEDGGGRGKSNELEE